MARTRFPQLSFFKDWRQLDKRVLFIGLWTPIALTLQEYWFLPVRTLTRARWHNGGVPFGSRHELLFHLWWVMGALVLTVLLPALGLYFISGTRLSELGVNRRGTAADRRLYLILFLLMLPLVWLAASRPDFRANYPLFRSASGPFSAEAIAFEAAYFLQFFAVEFFFRGVLVLGLKPALGPYSVLMMLTPYCMLHFHKPFPEALGAIVAGVVLGTLAYRSETVLYGWLLHFGVAVTMDCLAWRF